LAKVDIPGNTLSAGNDGDLQQSIEACQAILKSAPGDPQANYRMGLLALHAGFPEAALHYLEVALEQAPEDSEIWIAYIDALHGSGQVNDAFKILELARKQGLQGGKADALELRLYAGVTSDPRASERVPPVLDTTRLTGLFAGGRLADAAAGALEMIRRFPRHGMGWKTLGVVYQHMGRNADALLPMQKAVELLPDDAEAHNNLGIVLQGLGRLGEAEASYRRSLKLAPKYAQAHGNLGAVLKEAGRLDEAEDACRRALEIDPLYAKAHNNLGVILHELGRLHEAEAACRRALEIRPAYGEALNNLGNTLRKLGKQEEAEDSYLRALAIDPNSATTLFNLSVVDLESNRLDQAEARSRRALELEPENVDVLNTLGAIMIRMGRLADAEQYLGGALRVAPDCAAAHNSIGEVMYNLGQLESAVERFRRALQTDSAHPLIHLNLAIALNELGRLAEAESSSRRALELAPDSALANNVLGLVSANLQRFDAAADSFRHALEIDPGFTSAFSNLLFFLNYAANRSPEDCLDQARRFAGCTDDGDKAEFTHWICERHPARLRVGFVSGDFRSHPVGYFLEGMLARLREKSIDLIAYPTNNRIDGLTDRIKPHFSEWKPIGSLRDEDAARAIRNDGIHVLVDLSGHTGQNRLPMFALKPAPVQASWLGYFATTGVPQVDYLLGDPFVTPDAEAHHFTEEIWRLPEIYLCFTEPRFGLPVGALPAQATGQITFGCFNNLSKLNDAVIEVWARILAALPEATLFLKTRQLNDAAMRDLTAQRLARMGIPADRLVLEGGAPRAGLLKSYDRVDIALDPFPYPGGTTSVEGLWMGVPVITMRGDRFLSHVGETIAHNVGLSDWVASDADDYVAKAVGFGSDIERLASLRSGLREQVLASPAFDAERFARNFEQAMWGMWHRWMEKQGRS
jgi:predicted O-linked N-acetylglucosamine transferase (SPINDLY family)